MAKGYQANKERIEETGSFGKAIGKRAGFKCEWCESKDGLRVWDYQPDMPPGMETLALLCQRCRDWGEGRKADPNELRSIRNALWSDVPAVAEGAARVMAGCRETWVREAIEESMIDDAVKAELLK
jgi:protein PhnA